MARDARETKMHYSPSEKDGVFVVEVARGADSSSSCSNGPVRTEKPPTNSNDIAVEQKSRDDATLLNNEEFQVHAPPTDGANTDDELLTVDEDGAVSMSSQKLNTTDEPMKPISDTTPHTGLSQSDLSITSSSGSNKDYCYGSQQHYSVEVKGYHSASPRKILEQPPPSSSSSSVITPINNSKPVITAAIYKQESVDQLNNGLSTLEKSPSAKLMESCLIEEPIPLNASVLSKIIPIVNSDNINCDVTIMQNGSGGGGEEFDSLINLPVPPALDEIKLLADITLLENNNMDSLPPPPPPDIICDGQSTISTAAVVGVITNGES